jgi:hypothetical protein
MTNGTFRRLCFGAILLAWGMAIWQCSLALMEAYGSGAPYYSRTTNMDKWASPMPFVMIVLVATIIITLMLWWLSRRNTKN